MDESPETHRTRWGRRIAGGIAIGVTALAIGWVLTPRDPPILQGLEGDAGVRSVELERRVARRFPAGSSETVIRKALFDQGFTVSEGHARWDRGEFPCRIFVDIRWEAQDGRIAATRATLFQACA